MSNRKAPVTQSVYTPDDYDEHGNLKRLKEVPLGDYPAAVETQLHSHNVHDLDAPPDPVPLPKKMEMAPGPVQSPSTAAHDPPEFGDANHAIALVSWIANRNPLEDQLLNHAVEQRIAQRNGTYNPTEDPPIDLREITPTICFKVTRTFTKEEAERNDGRLVREYAERLHKATDWNIITLECGKAQPLPVSDYVRGIYKNKVLQQQMDAFYDNREKSKQDLVTRIKNDAEEGARNRPRK